MKKSLKDTFKNKKFILLYVLLSLIPFLWVLGQKGNLIGFTDFLSPFNLKSYLPSSFFVYNINLYGGSGGPFTIGRIIFLMFYGFFEYLGFSPKFITAIFFSLSLFLAQVGMYKFLSYIVSKNFSKTKKEFLILGGILYGFSSVFISYISAGHIPVLFNYVSMPIFFYLLLKIFYKRNFYKYYLYLFFLSLLNSIVYANASILYMNLLVITGFALVYVVLFPSRLFLKIIKSVFVLLTIIASNLWWFLPFILKLGSFLSGASGSRLSGEYFLGEASRSIFQVLGGTAAGRLINFEFGVSSLKSLKGFYVPVFLFLLFLALISIIIYWNTKRKIFLMFIVFWLVSVFVVTGSKFPLGRLFLWLYRNIPGFVSFRRPASKFYWFYLFNLIVLGVLSSHFLIENFKSFKKALIIGFYTVSVISVLGFFIARPKLQTFSLKGSYQSAREYLEQENGSLVLVLPHPTFAMSTEYDSSYNNYLGTEFVPYVWGISWVTPDPYDVFPPGLEKIGEATKLTNKLASEESACTTSRNLGLTHILLRKNLAQRYDKLVESYKSILENSNIIANSKTFEKEGEAIEIYSLKENCKGSLISSNLDEGLKFKMVNPAVFYINVESSEPNYSISFNRNYDSGWELKEVPIKFSSVEEGNWGTYPHEFKIVDVDKYMFDFFKYGSQTSINRKEAKNVWDISINDEQNLTVKTNTFILYNTQQLYFYLGLVLSVSYLALLVVLNKRKSK